MDIYNLLVHNLSRLDGCPLEALEPNRQQYETREDDGGLHTHLFTLVVFRLSSPRQEGNNVLGHLGSGGGSTVLIFNKTVKQNTSHGNSATREVRVVVQTFTDFDTSWGIHVTSKEGEDVVLQWNSKDHREPILLIYIYNTYTSTVTSLGDQGKIWGQSTSVTCTSSFFVGVGFGHVIGRLHRVQSI